LFFVILVPEVPLDIVQELLRVYPGAIEEREHDHRWNILQQIQWADMDTISPEVLRELLERYPESVLEEKLEENETPLTFFLSKNPHSEQVKVILECLRLKDMVRTLMDYYHIYDGHITSEALMVILDRASDLERETLDLERDHEGIFFWEVEFDDDEEESIGATTLFHFIFNHFVKTSDRDLFHRYLKALVKGRRESGYGISDVVDESSLTCCILYVLALKDLEDEENKEEMWVQYVNACRDDLSRPSEKIGRLPLVFALLLGHQWDPVLRDILNEDPSILNTIDRVHQLPPCLIAASDLVNNDDNPNLGSYDSEDFQSINSVNNTYELLRRDTSIFADLVKKDLGGKLPASTSKEARPTKKRRVSSATISSCCLS
jgi:hypothetical protein